MKKLAGILLVACTLFFFIGLASANLWTEGNLYMVKYEITGEIEWAYNLGDLTPMLTAGSITMPLGTEDSMVGFFALEGSKQYFATTEPIAPGSNDGNFFKNSFNSTIKNYYFHKDGDADGVAQGLKTDAGSYFIKFNSSNPLSAGQYAALNAGYTDGLKGEEDLSNGFQTMYLYETTQIAFPPVNDINPQYVLEINPVNVTINLELDSGWSMISLPLTPDNASVFSLFPDALVVYGYEKEKGYELVQASKDLVTGKGYWILLNQNQTYTLTGQPIESYTFPVSEYGWAMIGGCTSDARPANDNCNN